MAAKRGGGERAHARRRWHLVRSSILSRRAWAGSSVSANPARETRRRPSSARRTVDVAGVRAPRKLATRAATSTAVLRAVATPKASRSPPTASGFSGRAAARSTSRATVARTGSGSRRSPGPRSTLVAVPLRLEQGTASSCSVAARDWRGYWRLMTVGAHGEPSIGGAEARVKPSAAREPARQAGSHWFEPSTAHPDFWLNHACLRDTGNVADHLETTGGSSRLGGFGRFLDDSVEHRDGFLELVGEEVAVAAVDEGAAVVVADALRDQLGLHACAGHERDRGVAEPVEAEVGDDEGAAVAPLLVGEAGG